MNETTLGENPALEEAFAAFVHAQENGQTEAARQLLRDHSSLAEEVAMFYALCARVPKPWDSSVNAQDGRTIGDFELLHELGRGGEGVVYKARQKSLQTVVAVKVMRHERFASRSDVERFRKDWLVVTPDGRFDGSTGARRFVPYREPGTLKLVNDDATLKRFHRPGLFADVWRSDK